MKRFVFPISYWEHHCGKTDPRFSIVKWAEPKNMRDG